LYFTAETEPNHREIYYTDGTEVGTQRLSTLPLEESLIVYELFTLNDLLIFKAVGDVDLEIYASDGTHEGTFLLKDINTNGGSMSQLDQLIIFNNELYFQAYTDDYGTELWKTDGTTDGTVLVKDINPLFDSYALSSTPRSFAVFDNKLFFMADDGEHGYELWYSDGTTDGTILYNDINSGVSSSWSDYLTVCNNKLYFAAHDGTDTKLMSLSSAASEIVIHTSNDFEYSGSSGFISLFVIDDKLHFHANLEADKGWELYKLVEDEPNRTTSLLENQISIFPNPTKDYFAVNTTENDFQVQIFSIDGKLVNQFSNQHHINTNNLQSGIYNILIITKTQTFNTKLIKE
jgi:ELWxxDGT repeat protein